VRGGYGTLMVCGAAGALDPHGLVAMTMTV
jgi:hypothetical protein